MDHVAAAWGKTVAAELRWQLRAFMTLVYQKMMLAAVSATQSFLTVELVQFHLKSKEGISVLYLDKIVSQQKGLRAKGSAYLHTFKDSVNHLLTSTFRAEQIVGFI